MLNKDVFDFSLTEEEVLTLDTLDEGNISQS